MKIRGFTLNYHAAAHLNLAKLRQRVTEFVERGSSNKDAVVQPQITRMANREVITMDQMKDYSISYDKRVVLPDFDTRPYGTVQDQPCSRRVEPFF